MIVFSGMFLAIENEAAAARVEPGDPWTPADFKIQIIHRLMVALAALLKGGIVMRKRASSLFL